MALSRKQVAVRLGVSESTVQLLEKQGKLPATRVITEGKYRVRYDEQHVDALIASGWKPVSPRAGRQYTQSPKEQRSRESRAVRCFEEGKTPWQAVAECGLTMKEAAELYRMWRLGPDKMLALLEQDRQLKMAKAWEDEQRKNETRERILKWRKDIAEVKTRQPAPILLVRREEAAAAVKKSGLTQNVAPDDRKPE